MQRGIQRLKEYGNHGITLLMAEEVSAPLWLFLMKSAFDGSRYAPVIIITSAVIVQTTIVSINGSSKATTPSSTGSKF